MTSILLLETLHEESTSLLEARATVTLASSPEWPFEAADLENVDGLITRGRGRVTRDLINRLPALRVIARADVGLDNVDIEAATDRQVAVFNAPGSTTGTVAEHTLALMLGSTRQVIPFSHAAKNENWEARSRYAGDECRTKTLGVIGMGSIGQRVAEIASGIGMNVISWNRTPLESRHPHRPWMDVFKEADIVTLHLALTPETRHIVGSDELTAMKSGSTLINTSRGSLVNPEALLLALESHLAGYGADCLSDDPPNPKDPILVHPKTIITPHVAALTKGTYRDICSRTARNTLGFLLGNSYEKQCLVNPSVL